jgi:hypothetical protein
MNSINVLQSAKNKLIAIKTVHHGKNGATIFAIVKDQEHSKRRALRIVKPSSSITKAFIDNLRTIQNDQNHPLVSICEHDQAISWYAMGWLQGYNASYMIANHYPNGFPPFLVFQVLEQIYRAEVHPLKRGLCHVDLQNGENIMLRPWGSYGGRLVPKVTLIDYSGIKPFEPYEAGHVLEEFIYLARRMTGGEMRVPDYYRRRRGSIKEHRADPLREADLFYEYVATWTWRGNQTLDSFWDYNKTGLRVSAWVDELMDDGLLQELHGWLSRRRVSDEEIAAGVETGGLDVI